jgi:thiol-disulfide isomerase/thioredoxin
MTFCMLFSIGISWSQNISLKLTDTIKAQIHLTADFAGIENNILLTPEDNFKSVKAEKAGAFFCYDSGRRTFIYANPNDTIEIRLSPKGLIEYSCKNNKFRKSESGFINQSYENYGPMEDSFGKKMIKIINRPGLSQYYDPEYLKEKEMLTSFYKDQLVSKEFYDYFMDVYMCLTLQNELEAFPISDETISAINSFDKAEQDLNYSQCGYLLFKYNRKMMDKSGIQTELPNILNYVLEHYTNQKIKDYLLYKEMDWFLSQHHEKNSVDSGLLNLFRENCKNKLFLDEINKGLEPPTAPVFIENIIEKYRGKLVLVDFWASWCMPCRQEFPYERELMKKYPKVSFVFVSIDKSTDAWQNASKEYPDMLNKDNNYLLLKSNKDEVLQKIDISSIPRYVLFNKKGEIIDVNAPRPSRKELEILIEKYL